MGPPRLVVYPGERKNLAGVTVGTLHVKNGRGERYEIAGGPPPGCRRSVAGGHIAEATPPGTYVLDRAEHHTSTAWPSSVVPWGAAIRESDGIIEYQDGREWKKATGPTGKVTRALQLFYSRSNVFMSVEAASREARHMFFVNHQRLTDWTLNDFGNWSWNLTRDGRRTIFFVHTTPDAELAATNNRRYEVEQSHGCIHITPADRDQMVTRGYLKAGTRVDVLPYGTSGSLD